MDFCYWRALGKKDCCLTDTNNTYINGSVCIYGVGHALRGLAAVLNSGHDFGAGRHLIRGHHGRHGGGRCQSNLGVRRTDDLRFLHQGVHHCVSEEQGTKGVPNQDATWIHNIGKPERWFCH